MLQVCMGRIGSGWEEFLTQPTMVGQKKPNPTHHISPTQPTWVGLGRVEPMGLKFCFIIIKLSRKKNIKILKKPKD